MASPGPLSGPSHSLPAGVAALAIQTNEFRGAPSWTAILQILFGNKKSQLRRFQVPQNAWASFQVGVLHSLVS